MEQVNWIKNADLCVRLNLHPNTLFNWRRRKLLAYKKRDNEVWYDRREVERHLNDPRSVSPVYLANPGTIPGTVAWVDPQSLKGLPQGNKRDAAKTRTDSGRMMVVGPLREPTAVEEALGKAVSAMIDRTK